MEIITITKILIGKSTIVVHFWKMDNILVYYNREMGNIGPKKSLG